MNEQEVANLIWYNGNIIPKEKLISTSDFGLLFSTNLFDYFFTNGTDILFFNETQSRIKSLLKTYIFDSLLFNDNSGETFKSETKRLLVRNKYYKTARCYFLIFHSTKTNSLNEYIILNPDPLLFGGDKIIKTAIVSNRFYKPTGAAMRLPAMENEFRKIIKTEIEHEKVDDCIILDHDQNIIESYRGNIFLIEPGKVYTPSLNAGCTAQILRNILITLFEKQGFRVIEKNDIKVENLFDADEVIVAGETGIYSLKGIEYKRYFDNVRKGLIARIFDTETV